MLHPSLLRFGASFGARHPSFVDLASVAGSTCAPAKDAHPRLCLVLGSGKALSLALTLHHFEPPESQRDHRYRPPSPPRRVSSKNRGPNHAGEHHAQRSNDNTGARRSRYQDQPTSGFPQEASPPYSSPAPDEKGLDRRTSEEQLESDGSVGRRRITLDGEDSASVKRGGGISLEAGLPGDDAGMSESSSRGSRLAVVRYGDGAAPPRPDQSGLSGAAGHPVGGRRSDSGGEGMTGDVHRMGEARVAAEALVRAGGEQRTVAGERGEGGVKEALVRRSVPPALRLDNGTVVMGDRVGLRSLYTDPEEESGVAGAGGDHDNGDKVGASEAREIAGARRRKKESLEEWATAAKKRGRVDTPVPSTLPPSTPVGKQGRGRGNSSTNGRGTILLTPHDLKSARARAHKALLAGNITDTLEMCQQILQEWPHDGTALLYQGAAMAQRGEWDAAWNRMERVLALSRGVEATPTTALASPGTGGSARFGPAAENSRSAEARVPLDITLAAAANLASFARSRARETLDPNAETFFLVEGLRGAAGRHRFDSRRRVATDTPVGGEREARVERGNNTMPPVTSPSDKDTEGDDKGHYELERIDGYTDLLVMMAQALEGKGQLTSALRLYQRAVLLGSHRDQRALHGIGGLSRRLLEVERERMRRSGTTGGAATHAKSSIPPPPPLPTAPAAETSIRTGVPLAVASSGTKQRRERRTACDWGISHPRPGQVFSPEDSVQVEFDLTLLDPGLPSAGSLFETLAIGAGAGVSSSAEDAQDGGSRGGIVEDGLGIVVCSYLEGFKAAHCLPRGQLRDVGLGWHLLTAEAYQLPSLTPFSCPASAGNDSGRYRCDASFHELLNCFKPTCDDF